MRYLLSVLALALLAAPLHAHEVRPAYLELHEAGEGMWRVLFKVPARGPEQRLSLRVRLPADCERTGPQRTEFTGGAFIERSTIRRTGGLTGVEIYIEGLSNTLTDVLVRVEREDGSTQVVRLTPDAPSLVVEAAQVPGRAPGEHLAGMVEDHVEDHLDPGADRARPGAEALAAAGYSAQLVD